MDINSAFTHIYNIYAEALRKKRFYEAQQLARRIRETKASF